MEIYTRRFYRSLLRAPLVVGRASLVSLLIASTALAGPNGAQVIIGDAVISGEGSEAVQIDQSTNRLVVNWNDFDTNEKESVTFHQPDSSSLAVNVVRSGSPTDFRGTLQANGQIVLINTNGVVFGETARVDVAGLVASSADVNYKTIEKGGPIEFYTGEKGNPNAVIENRGQITVHNAGLAGFIGPVVRNSGVIQAKLGQVRLHSADTFTLDLAGDGLVNIAMTGSTEKQLVEQSGHIDATGGKVYITAAAARDAADSTINIGGIIEAQNVRVAHDRIYLDGSEAKEMNAFAKEKGIQRHETININGSIKTRILSEKEKAEIAKDDSAEVLKFDDQFEVAHDFAYEKPMEQKQKSDIDEAVVAFDDQAAQEEQNEGVEVQPEEVDSISSITVDGYGIAIQNAELETEKLFVQSHESDNAGLQITDSNIILHGNIKDYNEDVAKVIGLTAVSDGDLVFVGNKLNQDEGSVFRLFASSKDRTKISDLDVQNVVENCSYGSDCAAKVVSNLESALMFAPEEVAVDLPPAVEELPEDDVTVDEPPVVIEPPVLDLPPVDEPPVVIEPPVFDLPPVDEPPVVMPPVLAPPAPSEPVIPRIRRISSSLIKSLLFIAEVKIASEPKKVQMEQINVQEVTEPEKTSSIGSILCHLGGKGSCSQG